MQAPKMTDLIIEETSGVDHPAHLHEGWLVVKANDIEPVADVLNALPDPVEGNMADDTTDTVEEAGPPTDGAPGSDGSGDGGGDAAALAEELAIAEAKITELEARIAELEGATAAAVDEEAPVEESAEDVLIKSAPEPLRKMLEDAQKAREDAETALRKEREDRADAEAVAKARESFKNLTGIDAEQVGPALRRLAEQDASLAKAVEDALLAADAQQESASIFAEIGKNASTKSDAYSKMQALAKAKVEAGEFPSVERAFATVASENPNLYNEYLDEKGA